MYIQAYVMLEGRLAEKQRAKFEYLCDHYGFTAYSGFGKAKIDYLYKNIESFKRLKRDVVALVKECIDDGIKVCSYTIEDTLIDSDIKDELALLDGPTTDTRLSQQP